LEIDGTARALTRNHPMARPRPHYQIEPSHVLGTVGILCLLWITGQLLPAAPPGSGLICSLILVGAFAGGAAVPGTARLLERGLADWLAAGGPRLRRQLQPAAGMHGQGQTALDRDAAPAFSPGPPAGTAAEAAGAPPLAVYHPHMTSAAFAAFCAQELLQANWDARISARLPGARTSVVAERAGRRIALQCVMDPIAIGYRSVQQAAAARAGEQAAAGAVVANCAYTAAAEHFAAANDILLLQYRDLPDLARLLARHERRVTPGSWAGPSD
jgi:hypothetical protein